ncbi:MAG: AAA family ATPase [Candidatus Omnitrophota bacterium]
MHFKRLEIVGFKSFLNKTVLNFEPGITAVVGPNGCGKSNIFDAIRWVLGEQSVKSLRGSQMEDVIFNGTDAKEPLGMAEVSLSFGNEDRFFPLEQNEVMITRRIFRSGDSEYLLNKAQVRLKDILELLMGTGIGAESYSLIQQGKIDLILSSRPEDRRMVFDEASGITKYKAQKKEAARKMEDTEQNLLRINDIITEVRRQIGSLERQASRARRYKEIFEELKTKEITAAVLKKNALNKEKENLLLQVAELEAKEKELLESVVAQEASISGRRQEIKELDEGLHKIKEEIMSLNSDIERDRERISFNKEKVAGLEVSVEFLKGQIGQSKLRIAMDEEKLNHLRAEHANINNNIAEKNALLKEKEGELNEISCSIKQATDNIVKAKRDIMVMETRITQVRNELVETNGRQQIHNARKKRLEIEKARSNEERMVAEGNMNNISLELKALEEGFLSLGRQLLVSKEEFASGGKEVEKLNQDILTLEKEILTLNSHKEFLEELKTKYEGIGESMGAVVYLDKPPAEKVTGLVVKIKDYASLADSEKVSFGSDGFKLSGEAKPIDLDTQRIDEKIAQTQQGLSILAGQKNKKEASLRELDARIKNLEEECRSKEMVLVNKRTVFATAKEQFDKIKEEEEINGIELSDVCTELVSLEEKVKGFNSILEELIRQEKDKQDEILRHQDSITLNNNLKEKALVLITQTRTEIEGLSKRIGSDQATLNILEGTYQQDKETLIRQETQFNEERLRIESLNKEAVELEVRIQESAAQAAAKEESLFEAEGRYNELNDSISGVVKELEDTRREAESFKGKAYELQMQGKEVDFRMEGLKSRMLEVYKLDISAVLELPQVADGLSLENEIQALKEKIDNYGTVNLVAIEEYDELKKRYDFLTQQQADLLSSKEALHEAILKINRTTKKMFMETFEKVCLEFRNYFRLLFNGGDARIFLLDEQDPLESGIEIICRPPGKKLQNILLLSGGEKSMAAIALIFAIFKVKPAPFCVLDEIDAALDEANVDRFGRMLQEFTNGAQFIVITHNKKTIANATAMYGITMEESGVSKIVSVKFSQNNKIETRKEEQPVAA